VNWDGASFTGSSFAEHLAVTDGSARVAAKFADGTPAAYEHEYGKGKAILLGTFAGQWNEANPMPFHPLGEILSKWAGLALPDLKAPSLLELREMDGPHGQFVFLFNHAETAAKVEFSETLDQPAVLVREIVSGDTPKLAGKRFHVSTEVPAEAERIYRIDF
jgi:hypothetical protein